VISEPTQTSFSISPNPADKSLSIQFPPGKNTVIIILNELGQEVLRTQKVNSSSITLSTKNLATGIYFLRILSTDKKLFAEKLLIQH
jgi:hypothetical protein